MKHADGWIRTAFRWVLLSTVGLLLAAGCGGDDGGSSSGSNPATSGAAGVEEVDTLPVFACPVTAPQVCNAYGAGIPGEFSHQGVDLTSGDVTQVFAVAAGVVRRNARSTIGGGAIRIDHGNAVFSIYAHVEQVEVSGGQRVTAGQRIGTIYTPGGCEGGLASNLEGEKNLHLELRIGCPDANCTVDPAEYIGCF